MPVNRSLTDLFPLGDSLPVKARKRGERVWHGAECRLAVSVAERGFSQLDDVLCPRVGELVSVEQRRGLLVVRGRRSCVAAASSPGCSTLTPGY
jgi:hypothetical protein